MDAESVELALHRALEQAPLGVVVLDGQWRVRYVNRTAERLAQQPTAELIGAVLWDVSPDLVGTEAEERYRRARATGVAESFMTHYEPLGSWFRVMAVPDEDGLVVYFSNADADHQMAQLVQMQQLLLVSAGEGIYGLDGEGRTTFVNPAALEMLGYDDESELVGRNQHEVIHHSHADGSPYLLEQCPIHRALTQNVRTQSARDVFWTRDGRPVPVDYVVMPLVESGEAVGVVITFADITERVRAEADRWELERLQAAEAATRRALHDLQQAMQPTPLQLEGVRLGAHYRPALDAPAGGDLFDWALLEDGALLVTVVDIMGKGVTAAKDALAVTHTLRLLAMRGVPLGELVAEADAVLTRANPDLVATAVVATYHPPTRVLRVANGGHPPALLVRGADARYLDAPGRGVGFPLAGSDATEELELDAGDRVVFYTDGLIEGGRDVVAGLRQLARIAVSSTASHPSAFAGELVTRASAGARERDDCACVVLQAEP